jgi:N6-adenosine-specific RNA methylase IME4
MHGDPNKNAAAGKHYPLMSMEEICALPMRDLFRSKHGALFLWVTCPRANLGFDAIRAWGLHYRGIPFIWAKTNKKGELINGQGVPPTSTKPTTELCLLATLKPKGRPFPLLNSAMRQVVPHRRGEHSEKPAIIRDHIVSLYGDRPRAELFARQSAVGWTAWGNQAPVEVEANGA